MNFRQFLLHLALALLSIGVVRAQDDSPVKRELLLEDYGRYDSPQSLQISPDGNHLGFVLDRQIYVVSADGQEPRSLTSTESAAWQPRWSSDGGSLYFLSDRSDGTQLWTLPVGDHGEATKLTDFDYGIASIKFSPDESRLLLELSDNDLREEADNADPQPYVVTRRQFIEDAGAGYITVGESTHLYVYDLENGSLTQLTVGAFEESGAAWSPDGRSIVFVSNRDDPDENYSTDLWLVAADNTDRGHALTRLTDNSDTKQSPAWSPDGELIAFITAGDGVYGLQHLAVIRASGGEPKILTADLDRWVSSFEFSHDGDWIYFRYDDAGATKLARVRIRDNRIETLIEGDRVVQSFDVGASGDIAVIANARNDAGDIYRLSGGKLMQLTALHADFLDEVELGSKVKVSFESADDTIVEAFITTPPGYESGRSYPAILNIHGGPVGQFTWGYAFNAQFYSSRGYVVLEPNPRGSTGRGQNFINAIYRTWGITDYDDVMAAVDFAVAQGMADPDRLAVTGYSYGGYMTNVVVTRTKRFKAAASGAGHSLIEANFGHDMYQQWYMWELGLPWENRARYDVLSPVLRAANVETPTIFLGGQADRNVPVLNAELFYQTLKVRGIDSELVVYPDTHHGGWSEEFEKDYISRIVDWFDKYLASE